MARVVAVEGGAGALTVTVKLKVLGGAFFKDSPVELHLPGGKKVLATLGLPSNIDMLMKGDEVRVALKFTAAAPDLRAALVSEPGRLASLEEGERLLGAATPSAPATQAAPSVAPKCPFDPPELQKALGYKFKAATRTETPFAGGSAVECTYDPIVNDHATPVLTISVTLIAPKDFAASMATLDKFLAGKIEAVVSDPDGAKWQTDPHNASLLALVYARGTTRVEMRLWGASFKAADVKPKLLKLRRIP